MKKIDIKKIDFVDIKYNIDCNFDFEAHLLDGSIESETDVEEIDAIELYERVLDQDITIRENDLSSTLKLF